YFFMNCDVAPEGYRYGMVGGQYVVDTVGCTHVGLVVGEVSESGDDFEAHYLHPHAEIRISGKTQTVDWKQKVRRWLKYGYGGTTTAEKAELNPLMSRGWDWLYQAQDRFDVDYNCLKYYLYLSASL
ncbi:hypothetical protein LZ30DRAFT_549921, partial [Colletotrichum cereale]